MVVTDVASHRERALAETAHGSSGGGGGLEVVADGLDNPRGIGFGPDGALYVAESGSGGPSAPGNCIQSPEGGVAASGPVGLGFSGWTGYLLVGNPGGGTETREQFGPAGRCR